MNSDASVSVVLLTPPGRGAIATLLVQGPGATAIVTPWLLTAAGRPLDEYPIDAIAVGQWGGPTGDEVVVCRRSDDRVEIHCHGGPVAAGAVTEALVGVGCRAVSWPVWGRDRGLDLLCVEAREALASAATLPAAAILLDQYAGALRAAIERVVATLAGGGDRQAATAALRSILRYAPLGRHLVDPWQVVITGPPNVGKTTLLNALVGYQRGIVHNRPGTTRDVVTAVTALGGWPVELADTAGLQASHNAVETAGMELANEHLRDADAIVQVFDASRPAGPAQRRLAAAWPGAIRVANKSDLPRQRAIAGDEISVSALTGDGMGRLATTVAERLVPTPPPRGAPVPFCDRHVTALEGALAAATEGDAETACRLLSELLSGTR